MDYLKLFQTHEEYEEFVLGGTMLKPNVSHCVSENEVHYNPIETRLIVKYNVTNAIYPIQLYDYVSAEGATVNGAAMFNKVEIDGVEVSIADLDAASGQTQLSVGEHTAKYTLKDPTFIGVEIDEQTDIPTRIGADLSFCRNITSIEIPNSVTSIGDGAFYGCSGLTSVTIGNSVTSIGSGAFQGCSSLLNASIPNSVTSIGSGAFQECSSLLNASIPNSVTSIGDYAFDGCSRLFGIRMPNSVTSIGNRAFFNCTGLTSVAVEATMPPSLGRNVFHKMRMEDEDSTPLNISIYVPSESVETYKATSGWSSYASKIKAIQE